MVTHAPAHAYTCSKEVLRAISYMHLTLKSFTQSWGQSSSLGGSVRVVIGLFVGRRFRLGPTQIRAFYVCLLASMVHFSS